MAVFSTLIDNFPGSSLSALWVAIGSPTVAGNVCTIPCTLTTYTEIGSASTYDLTGSQFSAKMTVPAAGNGGKWTGMGADASQSGAQVNAVLMMVNGTTLYASLYQASVSTVAATIAYNSTTMAYWRIRESLGTIYWDYSADGTTWTNLASSAYTLTITGLYGVVFSGYSGTESASNAAVAQVNGGLPLFVNPSPMVALQASPRASFR